MSDGPPTGQPAAPLAPPREPTLTAAPGCPRGGRGPGRAPRRGTWALSSGRRPGRSPGPALRGGGGQGLAATTSSHSHGPSVLCWAFTACAGGQAWAGVWAGSRAGPGELGPQGSRRPGGQACSARAPCPGEPTRAPGASALCGLFLRCPLSCPHSTEHPQTCSWFCQEVLSPSSLPACQVLHPSSGHCLQEVLHDAQALVLLPHDLHGL